MPQARSTSSTNCSGCLHSGAGHKAETRPPGINATEPALQHREFLAAGDGDPRRPFAETLIAALAQCPGPILVYSAYEQTRLRELAFHFPDLEPAIEAIIGRLRDLLPIVRGSLYFPAFAFSNSIKAVAPALCPGLDYSDLDGIADGSAAAGAFLQLASGAVPCSETADQLRKALLAYCERDTLAMVEVHRALMRLADGIEPLPVASASEMPGVTDIEAAFEAR